MRNAAIKKYIHVYERFSYICVWCCRKEDFYGVCDGTGESGFWCHIVSTRNPKLGYTVQRLRSRRAGQMELLPILKGARK